MSDVLGLPPIGPRRHDPTPSQPGGDLAAVVAADHAQIELGTGDGGGEHVAVVDEGHVRVHLHAGKHALEAVDVWPVDGDPAAVEQARGGQNERRRADRDQACAGWDAGERVGYLVTQPPVWDDRIDWVDGGKHDGVRLRQRPGSVVGSGGVHGMAANGTDGHLVERCAVRPGGVAEDPHRDARLEWDYAVQGEDGDTMHGWIPSSSDLYRPFSMKGSPMEWV